MRHLIFVYGTLKKNFQLHSFLENEGTEFICEGYTEDSCFEMFPLSGGFPAVVMDGDYQIFGEVYSVNDSVLENIDDLEGNGYFYHRIKIKIGGLEEKVWIYFIKNQHAIIDQIEQKYSDRIVTEGNKQRWVEM